MICIIINIPLFPSSYSLGQIHKRKNFVERLDLNDVMSWYHTLIIWKEMTIGLPIGLRSKVLPRQKIAVSCTILFPTFTLLQHLLKKRESSCIWNEAIFFLFNHSFIHFFIHISHSLIHSFNYSLIHFPLIFSSFKLLTFSFSINSFIHFHSFIYSFIHSFTLAFVHSLDSIIFLYAIRQLIQTQ